MDRYTKFILTVIATCLVWLCGKDIVSTVPAFAQYRETVPVSIVNIDLCPRSLGTACTSLPVRSVE